MAFRKSFRFAPTALIAVASASVLAASAGAATVISNSVGLAATVEPDGSYAVQSSAPAWTFAGRVPKPDGDIAVRRGADGIGAYSELDFAFGEPAPQSASIRLYSGKPIVLFSDTCLKAQSNDLAFPRFTRFPAGLHHLSYGGLFGKYDFRRLHHDSPWLFFDDEFHAFLLSPAANFMSASDTAAADDGPIACGIDPAVRELPAQFTHRVILVVQNGINRAFDAWGRALTDLSGKVRPANDAAVELDKLGYWTDNGAYYYYKFDPDKGCEGTLEALRDEFARAGVPLGYVQLDSWWYPKSALATWQGTTNHYRGGIHLYQAARELFPDGLAAFQKALGLPLITHARWISAASPYRSEYSFSKNVPTDLAYWKNVMRSLRRSGVATFEQDWLNHDMLPAMNLDAAAFLDHMAQAAAELGIHLQYCMELPRHFLQGTLYDNLLTMRVSEDRFERRKWTPALYSSRLVRALGAWPWTDVFMSREERNLLLSTLSAGIVGVGDRLGALDAANLRRAVRADGVIVKPDAPLALLDQCYLDDARDAHRPMVAATYTDHAGLRAAYVFAYARRSADAEAGFTPAAVGVRSDAYVYDYFNQSGKVVPEGTVFRFTTTTADSRNGGSYFIVAPLGPSGIALLGDTGQFVTLGRKRIPELTDDGAVRVSVRFAPGETTVTLRGYAPTKPAASAPAGSIGPVAYDGASGLFSVPVKPNAGREATVKLWLVQRSSAGPPP